MHLMHLPRVGGIAGLAAALALAAVVATSGTVRTAQEPTPAGRLGGGAPLDATAPAVTPPPTATPARVTPTPGSSPAASPVASPTPSSSGSPAATLAAGEGQRPVACDGAPRSLDDVAALLMLAEPPVAPPTPTAAEWDPAARAEAEVVVAELVACGDAGAQLAAYALLTDAALVEYLVGSPSDVGTLRPLLFDEQPALVPAAITGLETRRANPGTVYLWLDLGGGKGVAATVAVARERGEWRIAGIAVYD